MRILLIEDDELLCCFLKKGLVENGFAVDSALDGEEGLYLALTEPYDLMVIDIMLPQKDGLTVIEELRKAKRQIPILILSAKISVEERVHGLQIGSDDYLTKPFAFVELLARIHALLRRSSSKDNSNRLQLGNLVVDRLTHQVNRSEKKIDLKPKEFAILEYLMCHAGEIVSRTMLMDHVWNCQFDPCTNVVDVHICHLREKIDKGFESQMIYTIRGLGYVLKIPE